MRPSEPQHGGPHHAEFEALGLRAAQVLDVSVNLNPYGPAASVLRAAREAALDRYLDPTETDTRAALAARIGHPVEAILLGNGAAELLWTLAAALADPAHPALIVGPTFSEYAAAVRANRGALASWEAGEAHGFAVDLDAVHRRLADTNAASVYLCTPNNPTGVATPHAAIADLARRWPAVTFIVDQAFLSLGPHWRELALAYPANVVALRSLTKDHAIPGLRVAYALMSPGLRAECEARRAPWTVNGPAQAALLATCDEAAFLATSRDRIAADRDYLIAGLRRLGLAPLPSAAPFVLVRVGAATRLRARMLSRAHVMIRDCSSFGLPDHARLAVRPRPDADRLLDALATELHR